MYEFLFETWIFFNVFQNSLRFYDPFLRSDFVNGFLFRSKITILTTLVSTSSNHKSGYIRPYQMENINFIIKC